MALGNVSADCQRRLAGHYGARANAWIAQAPALLENAASRWDLALVDYHDAGHASVVATATDRRGRALFLKAWIDVLRYQHEVAALRLWAGGPAVEVVQTADDLAVAAMELVGGQPGGGDRPANELAVTAEALDALHAFSRRDIPAGLPMLADYVRQEVAPRVWRRLRNLDLGRWRLVAHAGIQALGGPWTAGNQETVLHGDLYRENVLFSEDERPIFVDPLPMVGPTAFDWAFWVVYYQVGNGVEDRMSLALQVSGLLERDIRRWCSALFLDGLLYYLETADPRASLFGDSAAAFALNCDGGRA